MISISIVLYCPDWFGEVLPLLSELLKVRHLRRIYLVDNSADACSRDVMHELTTLDTRKKVSYLWNKGANLGYGAAHNIALRKSVYNHTEVHLVMNSDILVHHEDIEQMYGELLSNDKVGVLMPKVLYPNGEVQHLCKLLPTPLDVFGRRFLPQWMTLRRNERYTMLRNGKGQLEPFSYDRTMNVPYLSGCFMMLRTEAALQARLFDERYFMYPEDIDLCRTIHRDWITLYWPEVSIVHNHKAASYHSLRMLWVHIVNMCRYFNKWGWLIDPERRIINRMALQQL